MDRDYEMKYHVLEERHWWFRSRRNLVRALVKQLRPDRKTRILEIGCSSGVLIRQLEQDGYVNVEGIDISEEAIRQCHARGTLNADVMDAQKLVFSDASFDLITASDVLEHLQEDAAALRDWYRVLSPGGVVIVFVPAFPVLWSEHDVANHHFRRYRPNELRTVVAEAGFAIVRESCWNSALFAPIALIRKIKRLVDSGRSPGKSSDLFPPPSPINWALFATLSAENALLVRGANFPVGVSAMIIAHKLK